MNWIIVLSLVVVVNVHDCTAKNLPSYIKRCKRTDPLLELSACVGRRAEELKPYLLKGIPEMKLPSIEPLYISKMEIHTGNGTAVDFHAKLADITAYGVKNFQVKKLIMDLEKPYIFMHLYIPNLHVQFNYDFSGKVLLFQLDSTGKGSLNITDINAKLHHKKLSVVTRNGKDYLNLDEDEIESITFAKGSVYFENLFKDNPELTEQTNKLMNENFDEIGKDLKPFIFESVRRIVLATIKPVFDGYSLDELFE